MKIHFDDELLQTNEQSVGSGVEQNCGSFFVQQELAIAECSGRTFFLIQRIDLYMAHPIGRPFLIFYAVIVSKEADSTLALCCVAGSGIPTMCHSEALCIPPWDKVTGKSKGY